MSNYKVPQDVEADDKLLGPFTFRQFIYLLIVAACIAIAWGLSRIFVGLLVIPLPVILLFGALAMPLRKDQPMEIYLAAIISFYLKPHQRLWEPDGVDELIQITAPKSNEMQLTKDLTQEEAKQRLGYLANLVDSRGWAVRDTTAPAIQTPLNDDVFMAAQQTEDVFDDNTSLSQSFDRMIMSSDTKHHQELVEAMQHPESLMTPPASAPTATPVPQAAQPFTTPVEPAVPQPTTPPVFNPYPSFNQTVIQPIDDPAHIATVSNVNYTTQPTNPPVASKPTPTSAPEVSPDIMNLANNSDLSIETIAREANRIEHKDDMGDEVYVSLR